jgi:hypothetical protein
VQLKKSFDGCHNAALHADASVVVSGAVVVMGDSVLNSGGSVISETDVVAGTVVLSETGEVALEKSVLAIGASVAFDLGSGPTVVPAVGSSSSQTLYTAQSRPPNIALQHSEESSKKMFELPIHSSGKSKELLHPS